MSWTILALFKHCICRRESLELSHGTPEAAERYIDVSAVQAKHQGVTMRGHAADLPCGLMSGMSITSSLSAHLTLLVTCHPA